LREVLPRSIVLHLLSNMDNLDNILIRNGISELRLRLPAGWTVSEPSLGAVAGVDATVSVTAPDRRECSLGLEAKARLEPKGVRTLVDVVAKLRPQTPLVVVARFLSARTRERLREVDLGYIDLTGNIRIAIPTPGLYIETQGASEDPDREERPARSLRGVKAGRIVRALTDRKQPPGVRELAKGTKIDAGYVSRVLAFLDSEALVTRVGRGRTQGVDWPALLRRWAQEAPLESRGTVRTYLEPRGQSAHLARLAHSDERYVVTGSVAAATLAPLAPARLATIWIRDAAAAATRLNLRPAESGANVLLIEPNDDWVFEGALQQNGIWYAAPSQLAADLLTSPGRGPAEGEEMISWMQANEEKWRQ
jgi:hypothetical protein